VRGFEARTIQGARFPGGVRGGAAGRASVRVSVIRRFSGHVRCIVVVNRSTEPEEVT
jgi:hypothetical protein